jgi:hypothetical protein
VKALLPAEPDPRATACFFNVQTVQGGSTTALCTCHPRALILLLLIFCLPGDAARWLYVGTGPSLHGALTRLASCEGFLLRRVLRTYGRFNVTGERYLHTTWRTNQSVRHACSCITLTTFAMPSTSRRALLGTLALNLSGCAVYLTPEARKSIKRIAVVGLNTADEPVIAPAGSASAGGAALGLAGLFIGATIDGIRAASYAEKTAAAMKNRSLGFNGLWISQLESGLRAKGYETTRVDSPKPFNEFRQPDYRSIDGAYDAILATRMKIGFSESVVHTVDAENRVTNKTVGTPVGLVEVEMFSTAAGKKQLLDTRYTYGVAPGSGVIAPAPTVLADPRFMLPSFSDFYDNLDLAFEGMRDGVVKLSARLVADF